MVAGNIPNRSRRTAMNTALTAFYVRHRTTLLGVVVPATAVLWLAAAAVLLGAPVVTWAVAGAISGGLVLDHVVASRARDRAAAEADAAVAAWHAQFATRRAGARA